MTNTTTSSDGTTVVRFDAASLYEMNLKLTFDTRGLRRAVREVGRTVHRMFQPCAKPARCPVHNPRGNPPAAPHARGYHAKTRRRNRR